MSTALETKSYKRTRGKRNLIKMHIHVSYTVTEARNNGTVRDRRGNVTNTYDLRNITPFKE